MFDFAGLRAMGEQVETFTRQTGSALTDIASELRIANAIAAMHLAHDVNDGTNPAGVLAAATAIAASIARAERDDAQHG